MAHHQRVKTKTKISWERKELLMWNKKYKRLKHEAQNKSIFIASKGLSSAKNCLRRENTLTWEWHTFRNIEFIWWFIACWSFLKSLNCLLHSLYCLCNSLSMAYFLDLVCILFLATIITATVFSTTTVTCLCFEQQEE